METSCTGLGSVDLESERVIKELATDVAEVAELINHRIDMVNTVVNGTRDGLLRAQERDEENVSLLR